ncbi:MAG: glycosyltransferase family 9 protein [Planctomycetes bacterium]|nr:glycosyltransferase family 9 protein [Planctomycetota bacterium]
MLSPHENRIALVRLSALGDVVATIHAAHAIRAARRDARITWIVDPGGAELLRGNPAIEEVRVFPRREGPGAWQRFLLDLRARPFDVALDLHGNLRSGIATWATGARRRLGFAPPLSREGNRFFLTDRVAPGAGSVHRRARVDAVLAALGVPPYAGTVWLPDEPGPREEVNAFLRERHPGRWILFQPGASRLGDYKRWPEERYVELGRRVAASGLGVVVHGGPGEEALVARIAGAIRARLEPGAAGTGAAPVSDKTAGWGIHHLLALLRRCAAIVCADTAPLQLADALGVPSVGIFGPKDPAVYGPAGPRSATLYAGVPCSPCRHRLCDHRECLMAVGVEEVERTLRRLLGGTLDSCHA